MCRYSDAGLIPESEPGRFWNGVNILGSRLYIMRQRGREEGEGWGGAGAAAGLGLVCVRESSKMSLENPSRLVPCCCRSPLILCSR